MKSSRWSPNFEAYLLSSISRFWLRVKGKQITANRIKPEERSPGRATSSFRILLAEDNGVNQLVMLKMLKILGYRADEAANDIEVIQALEAPALRHRIVDWLLSCKISTGSDQMRCWCFLNSFTESDSFERASPSAFLRKSVSNDHDFCIDPNTNP
jgi:CheY-like chemotaxis protein